MKTYVIEDLSDDDLLSLLISEAHECSVPSESNLLIDIRGAIKARLTKRAVDGAYWWCEKCNSHVSSKFDICGLCKSPRN